eukprot:6803494-Prymnesium_polylepis.1
MRLHNHGIATTPSPPPRGHPGLDHVAVGVPKCDIVLIPTDTQFTLFAPILGTPDSGSSLRSRSSRSAPRRARPAHRRAGPDRSH